MHFAIERAGADLLDIGGEVDAAGSVENVWPRKRWIAFSPFLKGFRGRLKIPISVDTRRTSVAELAIQAGAELVNDVSGLRSDPRIGRSSRSPPAFPLS